MATWNQTSFLDASSPVMEEIISFHDFALLILCLIFSQVSLTMFKALNSNLIHKSLLESHLIETIWTLLPAMVLIQLAVPSLMLLYVLDESSHTSMTIKSMGHQWFWSYEYTNLWGLANSNFEFNSYLNPDMILDRVLDVDNRTVLPLSVSVRVLVGSADVLHAWAIPSLGVKVDACPGRLNQVSLLSFRPGLLVGQCSEVCGTNHSFMPIILELVSIKNFLKWLTSSTD